MLRIIFNTPSGRGARTDEGRIRAAAVGLNIPVITTMSGADAATRALEALHTSEFTVHAIQDYLAFRTSPAATPRREPGDVHPTGVA